MFGKECVHRLSEERRHKTWPRPCSGAGRLLRAVGHREKSSLMPWCAAFFTPLISSPSLNTAEDALGPEQQSLALITSIPRGPWYSKLKQWLLKESQIFWRCPSPNLPTNLVSLLPQLYPTQLTWLAFASAASNSLPVWIPKESFTSPPQLPTYHQNQPSASRLWGCKLKYVQGLDLEHKCADWTGERQQEAAASVGHMTTCVPLTKTFIFRFANPVLAKQRCLPAAFSPKGNHLGPLI